MRKVRLSKTKSNKFNESGQLFAFYLLSSFWALSVFREVNNQYFHIKSKQYLIYFMPKTSKDTNFRSLSYLWTGYPHVGLTFLTKFFFIIQVNF